MNILDIFVQTLDFYMSSSIANALLWWQYDTCLLKP